MLNNGELDEKEYKVYSGRKAKKICDRYVLDQMLFLDEKAKRIIGQWSSRYYQGLNEYIRGLIRPSHNKIKEYENFRKELSQLIESTSGLEENTVLFRGEKEVDVESRFRIGEENVFSGFISTSFSEKKALNFSRTLFEKGYLIKIRAKKGTKGIAINGEEVGSFKNQFEWLLDDNQKYISLNVDEKNKIIEIELL